ncbi:MAG: SHOCT domain-containing protein [Candidatus Saccharicenans sp.]|uniref:SHOCT domain-containing protein n=1 Tax=Candidatus Saccharicenans sp. TaxID=2819258 RepID=UPI0040494752
MRDSGEFNLKGKRMTVRPSPTSSIITLIMSILFLFFGLILMGSVLGEADEARGPMTFFLIIWVMACLGMAVYSIVNLASYGKSKPGPTALEVVEIEGDRGQEKMEGSTGPAKSAADESHPQETKSVKGADFGLRLRELESLKKEGLLTEEEYQRKRREILEEKW